jgi:hypothetical protein
MFAPFQVNAALLGLAAAHREEVTGQVLGGSHGIVVQQAANRMHARKALLKWLLAEPGRGVRKTAPPSFAHPGGSLVRALGQPQGAVSLPLAQLRPQPLRQPVRLRRPSLPAQEDLGPVDRLQAEPFLVGIGVGVLAPEIVPGEVGDAGGQFPVAGRRLQE